MATRECSICGKFGAQCDAAFLVHQSGGQHASWSSMDLGLMCLMLKRTRTSHDSTYHSFMMRKSDVPGLAQVLGATNADVERAMQSLVDNNWVVKTANNPRQYRVFHSTGMRDAHMRRQARVTTTSVQRTELTPQPDIKVLDHGSIVLLQPVSRSGKEWMDEFVASVTEHWTGGPFMAVVAEPRYVQDVISGAQDAGLKVRFQGFCFPHTEV